MTFLNGGDRNDINTRMYSKQPVYQFRSKRYREDYELISDFETIGDWTLTGGDSIAVDAVNFKEGRQGIRLRSINNVTTLAERTISINCFGLHPELWLYIDDEDALDYIWVRFFAGAVDEFYVRFVQADVPFRTGWNKIVLSRSAFIHDGATVTVDWMNITKVVLGIQSGVGETVNVTFDDFRMVRDRFAGKVTLRFDDSTETDYTEARPRMDEYGFRGVSCTIVDRIGTASYLTLAQLEHLQERGWDIISHSMTHPNLTLLTPAESERELWNSQRWLIENGFYKGSRFFAPPGGNWNRAVMDQIEKYYLACVNYLSGLTGDAEADAIPPNPFFTTCALIDAATPLATVQGYIDTIIEDQGWMTLTFHNITDHLVLFQNIIDYIEASGLEVVTFSDVFDELLGVRSDYTQLLEFGIQGAITPNDTSYPCPGGGLAAQAVTEIKVPVSRDGWLKNLRVRQRVASGAGGRTDIYTVRVNGVDTDLTCTLDNATVGSGLVTSVRVGAGDDVSIKLVSNNGADTSEDISITVELELLM